MSSNKLKLRALEPEDLQLIYEIENDESLWPWSSTGQPLSRYSVRQYLASQHADIYQDGELRLVVDCNGQSCGATDLTNFDPRHLRAEVSIVMLPSWRRQGLGREALQCLSDYARRHLRLRSLYAYVSVDNLPAQALFRAAGYEPMAQLPCWIEGRQTATLFQTILS